MGQARTSLPHLHADASRARPHSTAPARPSAEADQDPSTWLPPATGYRCQYATDWVADKTRWGLSIDTAEADALSDLLGTCPNMPITVATAR